MRARDSQRGVAFTEAIIVLPILVLLLFAVFYFHAAYRARLASLADARELAWVLRDRPACHGGGRDVADLGASAGAGAVEMPGDTYLDDDTVVSMFSLSRAVRTAGRSAPVPRILGSSEGTVGYRSRAVITCNEQNPPDFRDVIVDMFRNATGLL